MILRALFCFFKNGRANDHEVVNSLMNKRHKVERAAKVKLQRKHSMPTLR